MKFLRLTYLLLACAFMLSYSCSSSDDAGAEESLIDNDNDETDGNGDEDGNGGGDNATALESKFVFNENIVIENSYNDASCTRTPCQTVDENLVGIFRNDIPDDPYFSLSEDQSELLLTCPSEKGRRIEFKQNTEGPLTSFSKLELEGVYYDINPDGITIAQVHNRGADENNKPFFRLELFDDKLETVLREKPLVDSGDSDFDKEEIPFPNGNYDQSSLKVVIEKGMNTEAGRGEVHITVTYQGAIILDKSFVPDSGTEWVTDTGIANGFYLKGGIYNDASEHTKDLVVGFTSVVFDSEDQ